MENIGKEIQDIRNHLGLSQQKFADTFRISVGTLRGWEQNRRQPEGPALVLLGLIKNHPTVILELLNTTIRDDHERS